MKIETERLNIRNFTVDDWKSNKFWSELKDFFVDKELSPYAVYDEGYPTSNESIAKMAEWVPNNHLAVYLSAGDIFIGYIFYIIYEPKKLGLGYAIHSAHQRKGYATEAVRAFIDYVRQNMDITRVDAGVANANIPSVRLLEKLNFSKTLERTQSHRKDEKGNPIEFVETLYSYIV